jgi:hypothetical protein
MPSEINRALAIRQNRFDADAITIFHLKACERIIGSLRTSTACVWQRNCHSLMVRIDTLDPNVSERGS